MKSMATVWSGVAVSGVGLGVLMGLTAGRAEPVPSVAATTGETERIERSARRMIAVPRALPPELKHELRTLIAACYDPDFPPSQQFMEAVESMYTVNSRYELGTRWTGSQGDPRALTWSFVPDGLSIPSGVGEPTANSELFSRMDSLFAARGGRATWVQQFVNVFARWEQLSGLSYTRVMNNATNADADDGAAWGQAGAAGLRGDVRISMKNIDNANGVLAYNSFPQNGDMVLDRSESWASTTNTYRFLRNTIAHEHGHGVGFAHVCPLNNTKLMEPFLNTNFDGPRQDDIRAVQRHYGDPFEPNNSAGTASPLGTINSGQTITVGTLPTVAGTITFPANAEASILSLDANGESDYFSFTPSATMLMNMSVTAVGTTYLDGPQNANGSCSAGTNTDALRIADLGVWYTNSTGLTRLAAVNETNNVAPSTNSESFNGFLVSANTLYNFVVFENNSPTEVQMYRFSLTGGTPAIVSASDATSTSTINLTWTTVPSATNYEIFRNTTNNFATATNIVDQTTVGYADTVPPGSNFFYWVRVTQSIGGFSNIVVLGPDQGSTSTPANNPPVANAGTDQNLRDPEGDGLQSVTLNGSGSSDSDGTIVSYDWTIAGNPIASGVSPNLVLNAGVNTITLTVTDDDGATASDTVVVTITSNIAPTAVAGDDQTVVDADNSGAESIALSAAGSSDSDGTIVSYSWKEGATEIATGANPTVNLAVGEHTIELTVTDNEGRVGTDLVSITVEPPPSCPADFDGDGFVDFFDFDLFVSCFEDAQACPPGKSADFDSDGFVDFFDFDAFVTAFEAGC
jgi:hypothetical protein